MSKGTVTRWEKETKDKELPEHVRHSIIKKRLRKER
jgi:hypothetical protein